MSNNNVETYHDDGRMNIEKLYENYLELLQTNTWEVETVADSKTTWHGKEISFPIVAFKTKIKGPALYIFSGIHGEEPTGPHAIAESIDTLNKIGEWKPVVVIPLCNPLGYFRNWRYLNKATYAESPEIEAMSVGDCDHLLQDPTNRTTTRREKPANNECVALTQYLLSMMHEYPPHISIDFHGDTYVSQGYIYSQGKNGGDALAAQLLNSVESNGIPIQWEGNTRFGEEINHGIVGPQEDGSIDEFMSAKHVIVNGTIVPGPGAEQVYVLETPDADLPLKKRVKAYRAVIDFLGEALS